jgi:hypothetical protein
MCEPSNHKFISLLKKETPPTVREINNLDQEVLSSTSSNLADIVESLTVKEYVILCEKCGIEQE